jgi:hypothetical protein
VYVAVGDFNGDGLPDLAVANQGIQGSASTVSILLGNGDGTFQKATNNRVGNGNSSVAVTDLNGDGFQVRHGWAADHCQPGEGACHHEATSLTSRRSGIAVASAHREAVPETKDVPPHLDQGFEGHVFFIECRVGGPHAASPHHGQRQRARRFGDTDATDED